MVETITGWLFDVYPNETNLSVWLIGEDGKRHHFIQDFTATVYAAGPANRPAGAMEMAESAIHSGAPITDRAQGRLFGGSSTGIPFGESCCRITVYCCLGQSVE